MKDEDRQLRNVKSDGKQTLTDVYPIYLEQVDELIPELVSLYLQLMRILHWALELEHIDIFTEVVVRSQY